MSPKAGGHMRLELERTIPLTGPKAEVNLIRQGV